MDYYNLLSSLFSIFPKIFHQYQLDDSVWDMPHCVFELIVFPYIDTICHEDDRAELYKMGEFLEEMSLSDDINVVEVLNVSLLESLALEKNVLKLFKKYLKNNTKEHLEYWEKKFSTNI